MYKLLSVDDEPINQAIVEELFADTFDVALASSGEECINNIKKIKPDLVLLDVSMVGMDGYETCRQLKQIATTRDIPIIFVSARGSFEDKIKAYEAGGQDYITKPFNHAELEETIKQTIKMVKNSLKEASQKKESFPENSTLAAAFHFKKSSTAIITFLSACCVCTSLDTLGQFLLNLCQEVNLNCTFQLRTQAKTFHFSNQAEASALEQSLLDYCKSTDQFFDFNSNTIVTYPHISILIKNTPVEINQHNDFKNLFEIIMPAIEFKINSLSNTASFN